MAKFVPKKPRKRPSPAERHSELLKWIQTVAYRTEQLEAHLTRTDHLLRTQLGYIQSQIENYREALEPNIVNALKKHEAAPGTANYVKEPSRLNRLRNLFAR